MPDEETSGEPEVKTDEAWKKAVQEERERLREQEQQPGGGGRAEREEIPEPNIPVFMAGLYTQCLVALGEMENPATGKREPNRAEAQYLIDVIALLKEKMEGNLDPDESRYVQDLLTDLRMRYVSGAGGETSAGGAQQ